MYIDPMSTIVCHQAEIRRVTVEAERRRVAAERRAAAQAKGPLRRSSDRTPIRRFLRKTVEI